MRFVRAKGSIAYIGNGGGLQTYTMTGADGAVLAFSANLYDAVCWALGGLNNATKHKVKRLADLISSKTIELDIGGLSLSFRDETYRNIMASRYLQSKYNFAGNLDRLEPIDGKGVRIFGGRFDKLDKDPIDSLLRLASCNLVD